jgi:hypothetical protein
LKIKSIKTNRWLLLLFAGSVVSLGLLVKQYDAVGIGETAFVGSHDSQFFAISIIVANLTPISNGEKTFQPNEECFAERGGLVTVVGVANRSTVLVRYERPLVANAYNLADACPSGTLVLVPTVEWRRRH